MRFLRMLSNAALAAGLAAMGIVTLFLLLNPAVPLMSPSTLSLGLVIGVAYGVHLAVLFYGLIVAGQVVSTEALSPGWVSVRLLAWFGTFVTLGLAVLYWLNLRGLHQGLDAVGSRRLALAAAAMSACAVGFALLTILRHSVGRRGSAVGGAACVVLVLAAVGLPLAARGPGRSFLSPPARPAGQAVAGIAAAPGRVLLVGIDGASLDFISPAAAEGTLPHFGRLLDGGAMMHLATLRPTQPGPVWTAVATGKLPWRNGVRSAVTYAPVGGGASVDLLPDYCFAHALASAGLLAETVHSSMSLRARPLWDLFGAAGLASHVVRWPLSWPAPVVRGVIVSDHHHRAAELVLAVEEPRTTYPVDLPAQLTEEAGSPGTAVAAAFTADPEYPALASLQIDRDYADLAWRLEAREPADLLALRIQGLDAAGHYYLRQAVPHEFGDVSDEERRRLGRVLEQYYRYVDAEIGRALEALGPGDLLLVVSGFGMEPLSLPKRLLERVLGNDLLSGTHERAPDGFLLAYGTNVRPGRLSRGSVVDVTPTLLYYVGLPVGRDMDGFARTDLFTRTFTEARPIAFIPSYER